MESLDSLIPLDLSLLLQINFSYQVEAKPNEST
jgi:hypothetical protein